MLNLAWRNLWRNKRRTTITISSVFFAVFLAIIMRGFHLGAWLNLIDNVLHSYTGYVQVHANEYWDNKTFDYCMATNDSLVRKIEALENIEGLIPRLESFSLASAGEKTKGVITVGINPDAENKLTNLQSKLVAGKYLRLQDTAILLSQRLAKYLGLEVNDSVVLLSQGYMGSSATGIYRIAGIVKLPAPEFDNQMVYMPLPLAQDFFSANGMISSLVVELNDPNKMHESVSLLKSQLDGNTYEVLNWQEMQIELYQQFVTDNGSGLIILGLLYIIVGFGVFGTVLMMLSERKREMSIMVTLGMRRWRLMRLVSLELFIICSLGIVGGFLGSIPILTYYHLYPIEMTGEYAKVYEAYGMDPILPIAWQTDYMFQQVINVSVIVLIVMIYPLYSIFKMDLTKAMRR